MVAFKSPIRLADRFTRRCSPKIIIFDSVPHTTFRYTSESPLFATSTCFNREILPMVH